MRLVAQVPAIPERRSEQTAARLARKVGPLFGVASPEAPGGLGAWCCDYARLTLSEIMRGAPSPARRADPTQRDRGVADAAITNPIANVTAARFGPDTKAAFVLTGANELFAPIGDELVAAFEECPAQEPHVLLAAYAFIVLELFRSEPALILAAIQAQSIQRALMAIQAPFATGDVTDFAAREWGAPKEAYDEQHAPDRLAILDRLAEVLCRRITPSQQLPAANEAELGLVPELRLRRLVVAMAEATLLDVSQDAMDVGLRIVDVPEGRRADVLYEQQGRIGRFMLAIAPHVADATFGSGSPASGIESRKAAAAYLTPPDLSGDNLTSRARLTVYGGLISGAASAFPVVDMAVRHAWGHARERFADAIAKAVGPDDPEVHVTRLRAMVDLIEYSVPTRDDDPRLPEAAAQRAAAIDTACSLLDRLAPAEAAERISHGRIASLVSDLLVAINAVRRAQVLAPIPELPDVAALNTLLTKLWDEQLTRLAGFFARDSDNFIARLHNYAGFLVGRGSDAAMIEQGLRLYLEPGKGILHIRERSAPSDTNTRRVRRVRQIVVRTLADRAHRTADTDRQQALADIELARAHAREIEAHPDSRRVVETASTATAGNITAASLIECYVTSVELGFGDDDDQAWCTDRATALLKDAKLFVDGIASRVDRRIVLDDLADRLMRAR